MANRFGKSNWKDTDRLNLMLVCQQHNDWPDRLAAMKKIYPVDRYPMGYFTVQTIQTELERLLGLPTPNLRLDVSKHFVYSRKIMMTKWIEFFTAEIKRKEAAAAENALVAMRSNTKLMKEVLDKNTSSQRLDEIMKMIGPVADKRKNDVNFKRTVGSLEAAVAERLKTGETLDLDALEISATRPEGEVDMPTGTRGFLTPTHPMSPNSRAIDFPFSPMLSLAEAVREAVPIPEDPATAPEPVPTPMSPLPQDVPDDFLEPAAPVVLKSPVKVEEKKESDEQMADEKGKEEPETTEDVPIPPSKSPQKTPQKKIPENVPLEVKLEEEPTIKEEDDVTPSMMPTTPCLSPGSTTSSSAPTPRGRGRPRIVKGAGGQFEIPVVSPRKLEDGMFQNATTPSKKKDTPSSGAPTPTSTATTEEPTTSSTPTPAIVPSRSSRRLNESSQEPTVAAAATNSSRSKKPIRNLSVTAATTTSSSSRKRKEETEEPPSSLQGSSVPPILRSDSSMDMSTAPEFPGGVREIEVQTDITIRHIVYETPMGERRRANNSTPSAPVTRKGRKSQMPAEAGRSASRTSSASTPAHRAESSGPVAFRSVGCQTAQRFDIEKDELIVMQVEARPKYAYSVNELGLQKTIVINEATCKEIAAENAAVAEPETNRRATKADSKREITFIIETHEWIAKRLVDEKGYKLVSNSCDLPSSNDSPVKRSRRDERVKEDGHSIKYQLNAMHRLMCDNLWAENFRKPVPASEEGYGQAIFQKFDLSTIKKEIDNGTITTIPGYLLRCYRMLANAIMYNGYDHDVSVQARAILDNVLGDITTKVEEVGRENPTQRRRSVKETNPDTSRSGSMDPEPMAPLGVIGTKRAVYRKSATNEHTMSTHGSRKSRRSMK